MSASESLVLALDRPSPRRESVVSRKRIRPGITGMLDIRRNQVILAAMLGLNPGDEVDSDRIGEGPFECELLVKGLGKQPSLRCPMISVSLVPTPI